MKILISIIFLSLFINGCGSSNDSSSTVTPQAQKLSINGSGTLGIFDPSVAKDPSSNRLWMSYSSVEVSSFYDPSIYWAVSIRLAFSDDNGVNWQHESMISPAVETLLGPITESHPTADIPANSQGIWQSETSSLVYDPSAPQAERWKLI